MDLLHLVDRLEELVASAQKMPIGSRAIVDRRRLLDIVDQMRIAIPQEVREAQDMIEHRDELAREAEEDAKTILGRAEQRALRLIEEHEITTAARARAEEIARMAEARLNERIEEANQDIQERLADSRRVAQEQLDAADEYARELLQRLSKQLRSFTRSVDAGIAQLEPVRGGARRPSAAYDEQQDELAISEYDDDALPQRPRGATVVRDDLDSGSLAVGAPRRGRAVIDDFQYPELDDDPNARG
jgi:dsDNA-specific endonuclease/ATPase MutS2